MKIMIIIRILWLKELNEYSNKNSHFYKCNNLKVLNKFIKESIEINNQKRSYLNFNYEIPTFSI